MQRRDFLLGLAAAPLLAWSAPQRGRYDRLLILVELKGGNDGLNTLIPYADPDYARLRPRLALPRDQVIPLDEQMALHPALAGFKPLWDGGELAWVRGVGYDQPNLSHFRSIEIWETASGSQETLSDGWLARLFRQVPPPASFAAEGVALGGQGLGPLAGARAVTLSDPERFVRQSRLLPEGRATGNAALDHLRRVADQTRAAASGLNRESRSRAVFPSHRFGQACEAAARVAAGRNVAVIRLTLDGFDTHGNQLNTHQRLLGELSSGLLALREALMEMALWDRSLIMSYAEFGRRPQENGGGGTDHGTAAPHFLLGGRVKGGLYGAQPDLRRLEGGNLAATADFRALYASVTEGLWGLDARHLLGRRLETLDLFRA